MRKKTLFFSLALGTIASAPAYAAASGTNVCAQHPNAVVIDANQPHRIQYCGKSDNTPTDVPPHLANASSLTVVVVDINPLRNSFSVAFDAKPFVEIDGNTLANLLGVTLPTSGSSGGSGAGTLFLSAVSCANPNSSPGTPTVNDLQAAVQQLTAAVDNYRDSVATMQTNYGNSLVLLKSKQRDIQNAFQEELSTLKDALNTDSGGNYRNFATLPALTKVDAKTSTILCSKPLLGKPLDQVADALS